MNFINTHLQGEGGEIKIATVKLILAFPIF